MNISKKTSTAHACNGNGNLVSDGTRTFEWDEENRLVSITMGTHVTEFDYDGLGCMYSLEEKENGQVVSARTYLWDSMTDAMLEERSADGSQVMKRFYPQGFIDTDGTKLYYLRDHLGSIRELVDEAQQVRARYDYDPWGRPTKVSGDKDSPFLFTGHYWHGQSGLYLAKYRAYDPNLGRWISRDPIGERGGLNLYTYVGNDPINLIDPLGLDGVYYWPSTSSNSTYGHIAVEVNGTYVSFWPKSGMIAPWSSEATWHTYAQDLVAEKVKPQFFPLDGKNYPDPSKLPIPQTPAPGYKAGHTCADEGYEWLRKKWNLGPNTDGIFTPDEFWEWLNNNWGKPNPKWPK